MSHLRRTPPSKEALRHSGGDRRLWTSATVTLYLEVELSRERRPGTEQNTSVGLDTIPSRDSLWKGTPIWLPLGWVTGPAQERPGDIWIHFKFATELLLMGLIKVLQMQYLLHCHNHTLFICFIIGHQFSPWSGISQGCFLHILDLLTFKLKLQLWKQAFCAFIKKLSIQLESSYNLFLFNVCWELGITTILHAW